MDYIKGITFGSFAGAGSFERKEAYDSMDELIERTGANYIILVPTGLQNTPQSQEINFTTLASITDDELIRMIDYIHSKGLKCALKPTVNCKNGTWRAHISFFENDVPCEPKWSVWFNAYTMFQKHYAMIAERTGCEMFIAGCEMVQTEHRVTEWCQLIDELRQVYHGALTYNTDKYQEEHVTWWDKVDYICSSGYYPIDSWCEQLERIKKTVDKYKKPFFFAEAGCRSIDGAQNIPNDWSMKGNTNPIIQAEWYKKMFDECEKAGFVNGFFLWDWSWKLYPEKNALKDYGYDIYGKPAEAVVKAFYNSK